MDLYGFTIQKDSIYRNIQKVMDGIFPNNFPKNRKIGLIHKRITLSCNVTYQ